MALEPNTQTAERRLSGRYPIHQEVSYTVVEGRERSVAAAGKTVDMSSGGILFTTQDALFPGRRVEVAVNWPLRLDGTCRLKLVALGRVVRAEGCCAAIAIEHYEFRTQGSKAFGS